MAALQTKKSTETVRNQTLTPTGTITFHGSEKVSIHKTQEVRKNDVSRSELCEQRFFT